MYAGAAPIQGGIVKSLADVTSRREDDTRILVGDCSQLLHRCFPLFLTHAAAQHDDMFHLFAQSVREDCQVLDAFGEDEGTPFAKAAQWLDLTE